MMPFPFRLKRHFAVCVFPAFCLLACGSSGSGTASSGSPGTSVGTGGAVATTTSTQGSGGVSSGATTASSGVSAGSGGTSIGSGGSSSTSAGSTTLVVVNPSANVRVAESRQTVDGFGFSTAWGSVPSAANMNAFFSKTTGAGLSILRNRIPFRERPDANDSFMGTGNYNYTTVGSGTSAYKNFTLNWGTWDLAATKNLIATVQSNSDYELTHVFSTPWTPPNNNTSRWKLGVADYTNAPDVGGYLDPNHYQDYADVLADYVLGFESNMGAPLTALSLQNEPNFACNYESADWTSEQFHNFVSVLKTEFTKKGVSTALPNLTLMGPEHNNFNETLIVPTLSDANLTGLIGIVAGHQYEYGWSSDPLAVPAATLSVAQSQNKKIWMTEWSVAQFLTVNGTHSNNDIYPNLALAKAIHTDFSANGLNAYIYWWATDLVNNGSPAKVLWTLAQFSRFVRPGWVRVDAETAPATDVLMSAFANPARNRVAIVAVNMGTVSQTFELSLDIGDLGTITAYRTSATENLTPLSTIAGGTAVQVTVPAESITTFTSAVE